ncbi:SH3 domain-containing protein [Streptomyces sp. NPDC057621]|uniref:SH3 domain-containing protein n=1 Tax=Streptomyces liliiviolaceus TaxID=2823109 RepID=A0A941BH41_9ACTN|nr:SH3 domain-containing protein [Streptomyces liliiviolaceus]MBQ0853424.1 SH3 domain-containing protein [Streptomyces liliiviolaceus]
MSLRTAFVRRLGIAAACGGLVLGGAAPALAGDDWDDHHGSHDSSHPRYYKGRISAPGGLNLRDKPTRSSAVIGFAEYGEVVSIFCKTPGQSVQGNTLWYLLADGTWAWGAARYIDNIGASPRWC